MRRIVVPVAVLALTSALAGADSLRQILAKMDVSARSFTAVKADLTKASYTAVIDDTTIESGTMWLLRKANKSKDVRVKMEFRKPDQRSVAFSGKKGEIYYPKINTVNEYDLGKHKALVESFLLLGFGTSGKQLAKDYTMKFAGEEKIGGISAARLELTPKSKKTREKIVKVELWIALDGAYPVQQKFYTPSDDTTTITFSNIEINPPLKDADVALNLPAGVKREYPQK